MNTVLSAASARVSLSFVTDDGLDALEALYIRLLHSQPVRSPIAQNIYAKLCDVRLEMFGRNP